MLRPVLALALFALSSPASAHMGKQVLLPMVTNPTAMVIDGVEDDWTWYDPSFATTLADMDTKGSGLGYGVNLPGVFVDPSDYDFTYRIAWSPPPDNQLYFFIRIQDNALDTALLDPDDWWRQDFLHISIDADHSGGFVLGETAEEVSNGQRYMFRVRPPADVSFVQQAHSLNDHYSWSAGSSEWFDAAWTVEQADGEADFVLVDSPSEYGAVTGKVTYADDGSPRARAEVFLQDGLRRQRTLTDEEGRYRFQQLPGSYEVYARGAFGVKATVDVIGGETVNGVDFSPPTERDAELADAGRILRLLKENPGVIDEPVPGYGLLPPLYAATMKGYVETADLLLEHGADADATDRLGRTLLRRLTTSYLWHPAHPVMNRLIAHGASVEMRTALSMSNAELVKELVTSGGRWLNAFADASAEASGQVPLFDGTTLDDWTPSSDNWKVHNGTIVCPSSDRIQFMISDNIVDRPFALGYQLAAIERSHQDGKMVGIVDAAGNGVVVALDDEEEHTLQIDNGRKTFDDSGVHGTYRLEATAQLQMQLEKWARPRNLWVKGPGFSDGYWGG